MSALEERRQRAREAGHDVVTQLRDPYAMIQPMEAAIETATRVRITPEAVSVFRSEAEGWGGNFAVALAAALRELGFEVEE